MDITQESLLMIMKAQDFTFIGVIVALAVSGIMQVVNPKDKKPWTWLWKQLCKSIAEAAQDEVKNQNQQILNSIEELNNKISDLEGRVKALSEENQSQNRKRDDAWAALSRRHIILASDELRHSPDVPHSDEWWNMMLEDCSTYSSYAKAHDDFPNDKANESIAFVKQRYREFLHTAS